MYRPSYRAGACAAIALFSAAFAVGAEQQVACVKFEFGVKTRLDVDDAQLPARYRDADLFVLPANARAAGPQLLPQPGRALLVGLGARHARAEVALALQIAVGAIGIEAPNRRVRRDRNRGSQQCQHG